MPDHCFKVTRQNIANEFLVHMKMFKHMILVSISIFSVTYVFVYNGLVINYC